MQKVRSICTNLCLPLMIVATSALSVPSSSAAQDAGLTAMVKEGGCEETDVNVWVADLTPISIPVGDSVGSSAASPGASSYSVISLPIESLIATERSLIVWGDGKVVVCGEVGGTFGPDGSLVIGLKSVASSGISGAAYIAPLAADYSQTVVSLFVTGKSLPKLNKTASTTVTPAANGPTPTPTTEELLAQYVWLADVRDLAIRPGSMVGDKIVFSGTIMTIQVASPGEGFIVGDQDPQFFSAMLQLQVPSPAGGTEVISVGFNGDTSGMYEGTWVTAYGEVVGTRSGTNMMGGSISQPLVNAAYVFIG